MFHADVQARLRRADDDSAGDDVTDDIVDRPLGTHATSCQISGLGPLSRAGSELSFHMSVSVSEADLIGLNVASESTTLSSTAVGGSEWLGASAGGSQAAAHTLRRRRSRPVFTLVQSRSMRRCAFAATLCRALSLAGACVVLAVGSTSFAPSASLRASASPGAAASALKRGHLLGRGVAMSMPFEPLLPRGPKVAANAVNSDPACEHALSFLDWASCGGSAWAAGEAEPHPQRQGGPDRRDTRDASEALSLATLDRIVERVREGTGNADARARAMCQSAAEAASAAAAAAAQAGKLRAEVAKADLALEIGRLQAELHQGVSPFSEPPAGRPPATALAVASISIAAVSAIAHPSDENASAGAAVLPPGASKIAALPLSPGRRAFVSKPLASIVRPESFDERRQRAAATAMAPPASDSGHGASLGVGAAGVAGADREAHSASFAVQLAITCAELNGFAYHSASMEPSLATESAAADTAGLGLRLVKEVRDDKTDGYVLIAANDTDVYVTVRGSVSFRNVLTDCDYKHCGMDDLAAAAEMRFPPDARVHSGFLNAWLGLREATLEAIDAHLASAGASAADTRVHVTGHSMGGAIGLLAALELSHRNAEARAGRRGMPLFASLDTYTFAAPRLGNAPFAAFFDATFPHASEHWALQSEADAVPHLPLASWGYQHPGGVIKLPSLDEEVNALEPGLACGLHPPTIERLADGGDSPTLLRPKGGHPANWASCHVITNYIDALRHFAGCLDAADCGGVGGGIFAA